MDKRAARVHCLLGFPLDAITMDDVLKEIAEAARTRQRLFISTVNLNFVTLAQTDEDFRNSLRSSDLCVADGIAVKLIAQLLGIPIPERVSGSDILSAIWKKPLCPKDVPLKVFFFGGTQEAGQLAHEAVNRHPSNKIVCVGSLCPGYGSVEDMSSETILDEINRARPDFLIVALGAKKGQAWILQNMHKLDVPVISHLGATINFLSGKLRRAPVLLQKTGLEWLWRIKEEPALARRYSHDFLYFMQLAVARILPLAVRLRYKKWLWGKLEFSFARIDPSDANSNAVLKMRAVGNHWEGFGEILKGSPIEHNVVEVKLDELKWMDTNSMGNLLLLSEFVSDNGGILRVRDQSDTLNQDLLLNGLSDCLTKI